MRQIARALAFLAALLPSLAVAQTQLPTLPAGTVLGRLGINSGAAQAIPFATLQSNIPGSALTRVDDTNVTLTLGGTPTTALVRAASITAGWTGQLSVARGGTGLAAGTSGGIPYYSGSTTIASSAALAANRIVLGGGAGVAPATLGSLGTTTTLLHGNAAGAPSFGAAVSADLNITPTTCSSQYITAISAGGIGTCTGVTLAGTTFANQGTTAQVLHGNAAGNPSWAAVALGTEVSGTLLAANFGALTGDVTNSAGSYATTIAANAVTNAKTATMAAYTWKCNNTAGSAVPTDCDTTAFTLKASPVAADIVLIQDSAASNAWKRTTASALTAVGSVGSLNGQTGALVSYFAPQGRLTLATATPVMTTTQSAKTTIFYTPYHGNMVPIYDGTNMVPTVVAEISVATTDTTKNPAAIGASKVNDWFVWNDAGTIRVGHGPDWTNDTTRSAGTALVMVNGIQLNNASITNGPAASRGTYVGTTRSNGSSQLDFIFGASNTAAFFGVWNTYNRVIAGSNISLTGDSHNYTSATIRQASANALWQATFVVGAVEDAATVNLVGQVNTFAASGAVGYVGAALNSTSTFTHGRNFVQAATAAVTQMSTTHSAQMMPALGVNVISANEASDGTNSNGFNANSVNILSTSLRL